MAIYYFEHSGGVEQIEIAQKDLKVFKESNPHLTLVAQSKFPSTKREAYLKEKANKENRLGRLKEYPAIGDQLDALMKWIFSRPDEDFTPELNSLAAKCMSVKSKYPLED